MSGSDHGVTDRRQYSPDLCALVRNDSKVHCFSLQPHPANFPQGVQRGGKFYEAYGQVKSFGMVASVPYLQRCPHWLADFETASCCVMPSNQNATHL